MLSIYPCKLRFNHTVINRYLFLFIALFSNFNGISASYRKMENNSNTSRNHLNLIGYNFPWDQFSADSKDNDAIQSNKSDFFYGVSLNEIDVVSNAKKRLGLNWSVFGAVTYTSSTPSEYGVVFDGVDDYLKQQGNSVTNNPLMRDVSILPSSVVPSLKTASRGQPWAVSTVFKYTSAATTELVLWSQTDGDASNNAKAALSINGNKHLKLFFGTGNNQLKFVSNTTLSINTWYAVYVDYNGGSTGVGSAYLNRYFGRFRIKLVDVATGVVTDILEIFQVHFMSVLNLKIQIVFKELFLL
jgi:hypothetical protein